MFKKMNRQDVIGPNFCIRLDIGKCKLVFKTFNIFFFKTFNIFFYKTFNIFFFKTFNIFFFKIFNIFFFKTFNIFFFKTFNIFCSKCLDTSCAKYLTKNLWFLICFNISDPFLFLNSFKIFSFQKMQSCRVIKSEKDSDPEI